MLPVAEKAAGSSLLDPRYHMWTKTYDNVHELVISIIVMNVEKYGYDGTSTDHSREY